MISTDIKLLKTNLKSLLIAYANNRYVYHNAVIISIQSETITERIDSRLL